MECESSRQAPVPGVLQTSEGPPPEELRGTSSAETQAYILLGSSPLNKTSLLLPFPAPYFWQKVSKDKKQQVIKTFCSCPNCKLIFKKPF